MGYQQLWGELGFNQKSEDMEKIEVNNSSMEGNNELKLSRKKKSGRRMPGRIGQQSVIEGDETSVRLGTGKKLKISEN